MYCGYCGAEIEDDAVFCPSCGARTENSSKTGRQSGNKKIKLIGIGLAAAAAVLLAGIILFSNSRRKSLNSQIQCAVNNYQNGGIVATDGKWLYYQDKGLCRMRMKDGRNQDVISSDIHPDKMFCVNSTLYFYNYPKLFKLLKAGKKGEEIGTDMLLENCFQTDGRTCYFADSSEGAMGVFTSRESDLSKKKRISSIYPTKILMYKDSLYIVSGYNNINGEANKNYGVWKINKKGGKRLSLTGTCPSYVVFSQDKIYFTEEWEGTISAMTLDGDDPETFEGKRTAYGLNVSDDYIFYLAENDDYSVTVHRMDKDGKNDIELNKDDSRCLNIIGDWIYYINKEHNDEIYKMSFDGSYNQPIY